MTEGVVGAVEQIKPAAEQAAVEPLRPASYWPFVVPALVVVGGVIVFPWAFTIWMSLREWKIGGANSFIGFDNYIRLVTDTRFLEFGLAHRALYRVVGDPSAGARPVRRDRVP